MSDDEIPRGSKRPIVTLLLILCLPIVPAVVLRMLVDDHIEQKHATILGDELAQAIKKLPPPSGDPVDFSYHLETGATWRLRTRFSSPRDGTTDLPDDAAPDEDFAAELKRRGGVYRLTVVGEEGSDWIVKVEPEAGADARGIGEGAQVRWGQHGELEWVVADRERMAPLGTTARVALFTATGIWILGPVSSVRMWDRPEGVPQEPESFKAASNRRLFEVEPSGESSGHGGTFYGGNEGDAPPYSQFHHLAYRRTPVAGEHWTGRYELAARGRHTARASSLHLLEGEFRLHEIFTMTHDDEVTTGHADHTVVVHQFLER